MSWCVLFDGVFVWGFLFRELLSRGDLTARGFVEVVGGGGDLSRGVFFKGVLS